MLFSFFLSSDQREIQLDEPRFEVLMSDEIYFRNLRMSSYLVEEDSASGFDLLIHKKERDVNDLQLVLIRNWREREAFIFMKTLNPWIGMRFQNGEQRSLREVDAEYHWITAVMLYNATLNDESIRLLSDGSTQLTIELTTRENLRQTLKDYFKLTNALP